MIQEEERVRPERWLTEEQVCTLFYICGFKNTRAFEIPNKYWPPQSDYDHERWPWWMVKTEFGLIEFGWRKRVIQLDWSDTKKSFDLTDDETTKEEMLIHAWGYSKMIEYLTQLNRWFRCTPEGEARYRKNNHRP